MQRFSQTRVRNIRGHGGCFQLILFLCLGALCVPWQSCLGQASVIVNNDVPGTVVAPIYGIESCDSCVPKVGNTPAGTPGGIQFYTGSLLAGSGYWAQVFGAAGADQPESSLLPATALTSFGTGASAGFLIPYQAILANIPPDAPVATLQLRVWDNTSGSYPTWTQAYTAWLSGLTSVGLSAPFNVSNLGGTINGPPYLTGLRSFNLSYPCMSPNVIFITDDPTNQTVMAGRSAAFFVQAYGDCTYQWLFNGNAIAGATRASYTIPSAQLEDAGDYSVALSNACQGTVFSSNATLTVASLSIHRAGNEAIVTWTAATLQTTTDFAGPWTDLTDAVSPLTNIVEEVRRFYRLRL